MASRWTLPLAALALGFMSPMYDRPAQGQEDTRAAVVGTTGALFVTFEYEHLPPGFAEAVERESGKIIGTWSPFVPTPPGGARVLPGGLYAFSGGTSAAAPHVAGAAAQPIGRRGRTNPALVRILLQRTAVDLGAPGRDPVFGSGLLNVWELLKRVPE